MCGDMNDEKKDIFAGLNPAQRDAVENTEGPVLIVAGAGSGKTRVLTCRIANILSKGVSASSILSLTFTKKAATEMKERVAAMVGWRTARGVVMGTFHSVFVRFLRDYAESLGYPREFTIHDTSDSTAMVKTCLKELNLDDKVYKPKTVLGRISEAKNNLCSPAAYMGNMAVLDRDRVSKMPRLAEVYDLYWKKCRANGVMDFDDILFEMNILLRDNPAALEEISARFSYILVDEYQDTNRAQYLIMRKLAAGHKNICVVGDDSQSIYAFRGAKIENILNFKKDYPGCKTFRLEQNYRSTQTIVDAANSLISHNEGRIPKTCFSAGDKGEPIRLVKAYTEQEEASLVVSGIAEMIRRDSAQYQDFAVLYRTNSQSRALEEALRRRNIPYMIYSGNSFFERAEVKDLMAYFKLCCNPCDDESFKRAISKPSRGIGETSVEALSNVARTAGVSLFEAAYRPDALSGGLKQAGLDRILKFCNMIADFSGRIHSEDAYTLAANIARDSGIWQLYKSDLSIEGQARFANIEELCNSVQAFVEQRQSEIEEENMVQGGDESAEAGDILITLSDYLENVALLSAVDVDDEESSNKVALMTAHSSKGLEFPYVFIVGLEENLFPSGSSAMARPSDIEEERRLFYVAITRAKKALRLCYAVTRMRNGKSESNPVSRFVREIDPKYIENPLAEGMKQVRSESFWSSVNNTPKPTLSSFGKSAGWQHIRREPLQSKEPAITPQRPVLPPRPAPRVPDSSFEPSPIMDLRQGQRVEHNRFGFGVIREIIDDDSGMKVRINFDDFGEKVLLTKYAKIRII